MNPPEMGWLIARSRGTPERARSVVVIQQDLARGRMKCTFTDTGFTEWYDRCEFFASEAAACKEVVRRMNAKIETLNKQIIAATETRDDAARRC